MLQHLNKYLQFDHANGVTPFLLINRHGSRFELPFLEYKNNINDEGHKWAVSFCVPYGIALWQVEAKEQKGSFKMELTWVKHDLLGKKNLHHLNYATKK